MNTYPAPSLFVSPKHETEPRLIPKSEPISPPAFASYCLPPEDAHQYSQTGSVHSYVGHGLDDSGRDMVRPGLPRGPVGRQDFQAWEDVAKEGSSYDAAVGRRVRRRRADLDYVAATRFTPSPPTGFRHNFTVDDLIPLNSPTQPRTYVTPSRTSARDVSAVAAQHDRRSWAIAPWQEETRWAASSGESVSPSSDLQGDEHIKAMQAKMEHKRRQNTISARRTRHRKMEMVETIRGELDEQRRRARQAEEDLAKAMEENAVLRGELNRAKGSRALLSLATGREGGNEAS